MEIKYKKRLRNMTMEEKTLARALYRDNKTCPEQIRLNKALSDTLAPKRYRTDFSKLRAFLVSKKLAGKISVE